ncbi:hypothetical protein SAY86_024665 [Trapa natans]|uniref:peroxidase n=1 Tax=Trapa natans TaxID=22666 RepID=A0AAN7MPR7_TRANT|nr:hypothetical protein SAY86_024665 [Trapa natans]
MTSSSCSNSMAITGFTLTVLLVVGVPSTNGQLSTGYYYKSCPGVFATVKSTVHSAIAKEARMGASLLRLFFHDCFVNLGGPSWDVKLGRRDARTASQAAANSSIPPPTSSLSNLISSYRNVGLSTQDMVALSGINFLL